jgi:hypothetical protein
MFIFFFRLICQTIFDELLLYTHKQSILLIGIIHYRVSYL